MRKPISQAPLTPVSHATIFTGTYPQFHTVTDFGHPLPALLPFVPEILQKSGYRTAAFIGSLILDPKANMAPGFDRGFDFFDAGFHPKRIANESRYDTVERRAGDVDRPRYALVGEEPDTKTPFFIWVHLYDPHAPYDPPDRLTTSASPISTTEKSPTPMRLWANSFTILRQRGLYDRALIAMMSDHGESLGAHGESMHGIFLYDETIRVPLLFKLPGALLAGRRVDHPGATGGRRAHSSEHVELAAATYFSRRVSGPFDESETAAAGKGDPKTCGRSPRLRRN